MRKLAKIKILALLCVLNTWPCQIHRGKFTRFGYFIRPFDYNVAVNTIPITTHQQIYIIHQCVKLCINHPKCLSINFDTEDGICELLDKDRRSLTDQDLQAGTNKIYMDSRIHFDICGRENKCFPCKCQLLGLKANETECDCSEIFPQYFIAYSSGNVLLATISFYNHDVYAADQNGVFTNVYGADPCFKTGNWKEIFYQSDIKQLEHAMYKDNSRIFILYDSKIYYHNGIKLINVHDTQRVFEYFSVAPGDILLAIENGDLLVGKEFQLDVTVKGPITAVQEYQNHWYAIGKECKCILKHKKIVSNTHFTWEVITTNPGSCVQFKVNFNGIIYARFENNCVYEWEEAKQKWINTKIGPCIDFDVVHYILCVRPNFDTISNWHTIPRPNIHIPFKTYNDTERSTPYAIGMDYDGTKHVVLDDKSGGESSTITLDQFGKRNVLQTSSELNLKLVFGNFDDTVLVPQKTDRTQVTLSIWIRLSMTTFLMDNPINILSTRTGEIGLFVFIKHDGVNSTIYIRVGNGANDLLTRITPYDIPINKFFYWTLVAFRVREKPNMFAEISLNGTVYAAQTLTSVYSGYKRVPYLFTSCKACFMSDLTIWHVMLSGYQLIHLYHQETIFKSCYLIKPSDRIAADCNDPQSCVDNSIKCVVPKCFQNSMKDTVAPPSLSANQSRITATSCQQLLQQNPLLDGAGYYWIMLNGQIKSVYCDMTTDGGGWTLVSSFSHEKLGSNQTSSFLNDLFVDIDMTYTNTFVLSAAGFLSLKEITNFRQIRYHCTSGLHSRVVDIATKGVEILEFLLKANTPIPDPCKTYYRLPDDTSEIFAICNDVKFIYTLQSSDEKLYGSFSGSMQRIAFGMRSLFLCDSEGGVANSGKFKVYIR